MARRRSGGRIRRSRKKNIIWDSYVPDQADLPTAQSDNTVTQDGSFTSLQRYTGTDATLRMGRFHGCARVNYSGTAPTTSAVVRICIGIAMFDSMADASGQATLATIADGTGPSSDADNSRWWFRICFDIPIGDLVPMASGAETANVTLYQDERGQVSGIWSALDQRMILWWNYTTKSARRLRGFESEWMQLCLEQDCTELLPAAATVTTVMNSFEGRSILQIRS